MADTSHILIVDDDPDIRKVLFFLLKDKYFVEEAADGAAAVEYIAAHPETDLVVLDVMMPGMSGYEACGKIRAISNAPILFLTAKSAEAAVRSTVRRAPATRAIMATARRSSPTAASCSRRSRATTS